jgi:hypothetical protein
MASLLLSGKLHLSLRCARQRTRQRPDPPVRELFYFKSRIVISGSASSAWEIRWSRLSGGLMKSVIAIWHMLSSRTQQTRSGLPFQGQYFFQIFAFHQPLFPVFPLSVLANGRLSCIWIWLWCLPPPEYMPKFHRSRSLRRSRLWGQFYRRLRRQMNWFPTVSQNSRPLWLS